MRKPAAALTSRTSMRHEVGRLLEAERQHAIGGAHVTPLRRVLIVGIDDGDAFHRQRLEHFAFAGRDALQAAEAFEVRRARIGHDADRSGSAMRREMGDLTQMIRAHLDHGVTMLPSVSSSNVSGTPM